MEPIFAWAIVLLLVAFGMVIVVVTDRIRKYRLKKRLGFYPSRPAPCDYVEIYFDGERQKRIAYIVYRALQEELPIDLTLLHPDAPLSLGEVAKLDSLCLEMLVTRIEQELRVKLCGDQFVNATCIRDIVNCVDAASSGRKSGRIDQ